MFLIGALYPGAFVIPRTYEVPDLTSGTWAFQAASSTIYLIALAILITRHKRAIYLLSRNKTLVVFVLLTVASAFWATLPELSLRRSLALVGTTVFGCYLAVRYEPEDVLKLLAWAFAFTIVQNLFVIFAVPAKGVDPYAHEGSWQGVFGHKNDFGRIMLLGAIVFWVVPSSSLAARNWAWVGIFLSLLMVVFSQSRTAWLITTFVLISIPFLLYVQRSNSTIEVQIRLLLIGLSFGCLGILAIEYLNEILILLQRDTTLTGRTEIWAKSIEVGLNRFWFGHGYRSFWTGLFFRYGHGHNSFLDIWLELGLVGISLFTVILAIFLARAVRHLIKIKNVFGLWYILLSIYIILFSLTSQVIPEHGTIIWALYVAMLLQMSRAPTKVYQRDVSRMIPEEGLRV